MPDFVFQEVMTEEQVAAVAQLGERIWREYYGQLLGERQVAYMLRKFQSREAIASQLQQGYTYWLVLESGVPCGYCGFVREGERLFLSKLYLCRESRGKGAARQLLERLRREAGGMRSIYLTVNKNNTASIAVYRKLGFRQVDAVVTDIGQGFVMDDYIMELPLSEERKCEE